MGVAISRAMARLVPAVNPPRVPTSFRCSISLFYLAEVKIDALNAAGG